MAKNGKKYLEAAKLVDSSKRYSIEEAAELVKKTSVTKFDATVELVFKLNLDPRKAEQNLRGSIVLPYGSGKTRKVLVLTRGAKEKEAQDAGADFVGNTEYIEKIKGGWFDFDIIVATPDMMGELGKIGKILGPKGLMPNAKTGTVTPNIEQAVKEIKAGKVEYRVDKNGNIATIVGKVSFDKEKLAENIKAVYAVISKTKPQTVKGVYVKNVALASTMGPGIKLPLDL
ncbi:MAG: 50S ribosomal protein L1 [Bacilli bacterium]|jgi:large subunit ribosomal protein L1|nr:50S ribosomal protein L1 [Bacilli bacterium]